MINFRVQQETLGELSFDKTETYKQKILNNLKSKRRVFKGTIFHKKREQIFQNFERFDQLDGFAVKNEPDLVQPKLQPPPQQYEVYNFLSQGQNLEGSRTADL